MVKSNNQKTVKISKELLKKQLFALKDKTVNGFDRVIDFYKRQKTILQNTDWKSMPAKARKNLKKIKLQKTSAYKFLRKFIKKISASWKVILTVIPLFLIFYYGLGSKIVENMDVKTEYKTDKSDNAPFFKTAEAMAFLVRREVDDKMWTPNLPMIFPAYVLDNMPNFQIGIITAVKDVAGTMRYFKHNTEMQNQDIKTAYKLLNYAPDVWIMSRKGKFNLAPSSNSQYRKAANELRKFMRDGIYKPDSEDLRLLLKKFGSKLQKLTLDCEDYVKENDLNWYAGKADDLFYNHRGYAFALWQISKSLGRDYKEIILANDLYEDWVRMNTSLKKAAEFSPLIVRNGKVDSIIAPNHLMMQNYYLLRAISAAEKIRGNLSESVNAD